jgi:hypothetical protein
VSNKPTKREKGSVREGEAGKKAKVTRVSLLDLDQVDVIWSKQAPKPST